MIPEYKYVIYKNCDNTEAFSGSEFLSTNIYKATFKSPSGVLTPYVVNWNDNNFSMTITHSMVANMVIGDVYTFDVMEISGSNYLPLFKGSFTVCEFNTVGTNDAS